MFLAVSSAAIIFPIIWAVVGFAVLYSMAKSRGRNPILWAIFGALTFVVALVVILIAGPSDDAPR